ncbi:uncharacterized protein [Miscanthus floridulus]|uniref:uncharacterized protein isoform X4 n=1 Tax=Miscanthus floridulus TaxID=154761 RepID=UPI00345B171B
MAYYRFVATALLLRQCQWWHKMQSRQQQHSQPACPSSFLSTYHEQAGQGCRWCRIEPPMTLIGCLLAVAADSDGEGSAAASNETLATVFTQFERWRYLAAFLAPIHLALAHPLHQHRPINHAAAPANLATSRHLALARPACSTSPSRGAPAKSPHTASLLHLALGPPPSRGACAKALLPPAAICPSPSRAPCTSTGPSTASLAGTNKHRPSVAKMFTE